ncbi:DUF211 domain-containing protein [Candidatus Woesearchaeota archaeon]|nr:DUF211 domain-containing protein [Candidatus Woesearchaeota archaeon]MBW3005423.1 DUF211 domain-containing protein [Candidatus Woesearchaeota archaeon]
MTNKLRIIVLDILKPHKPDIIDFGIAVEKINGVNCLNLSVYAVDEKTESIKVALEGKSLDMKKIKKLIEDFGAVIHSIDKAVIGESKIINVPDLK